MRSFFLAAALTAGAFTFTSCENENDAPTGAYAANAVLIANEGSFNASNASVSYYNRNSGKLENNIFSKQNNPLLLGDVLQDISTHDDRAFLVVNNSQKMYVANANTFKVEGEINGLKMPRYFAALDNQKGYVTEWVTYDGNGRVAVVDLKNFTVTKTIEVGINPEKLLVAGGKVYVANSGGNTVSVINTATDTLEATIPVTYGPNSLALDKDNNLWVTSRNNKAYNQDWTISEELSEPGALTKISTANNTVVSTFTFSRNAPSPKNLTTNAAKDKLYFVYDNKVYRQDIAATALSSTPLINRGASYPSSGFYGLGVDPVSGYIYAGKVPGFTSDGWVIRYNPSGAAVDSFRVGVAPNGFAFR